MDLQEQLGFFPSQGELLGFAPQSISNSSLWITALKKGKCWKWELSLLPCWDDEWSSLRDAEISWQEKLPAPGQQRGGYQSWSPAPLLTVIAISASKSPLVLQHLLLHPFPCQAIPLSHFYTVVNGLKMRGRARNPKKWEWLDSSKIFLRRIILFSLTLKFLQGLNWSLVYKFDDWNLPRVLPWDELVVAEFPELPQCQEKPPKPQGSRAQRILLRV